MFLNPYIAGNPIGDQNGFFGRQDIFREVMQVLRHPKSNAVVLYGQRRIGKTSVLLQLERQLGEGGELTPVYFDLQDKAGKPLNAVLYELAQRIALVVGQEMPKKVLFDAEGRYFQHTFLPQAANPASKGGLVLLFDEFDVLDSPKQVAGNTFFPYLRSWMGQISRVQFVFVIGRRPEDLSINTISTLKGIRARRVSLLDHAITLEVVRQSEQEGTLNWPDSAANRLWQWTQGHPYLTQLLCSVVWEHAYEEEEEDDAPQITSDHVDQALDKALEQGANAFYWIWEGLPPAERVVMSAMAEEGDTVITNEKLVEILNRSGVRLIVRQLELAPETLVKWDLLRPVEDGYQFTVPLLRHWVSSNRPLRRVKEELDHLEPAAESLFQSGQYYYRTKQVKDAEDQLRRALQLNPNHLKAQLLLGKLLLENDRISESLQVLEEAYRYDAGATHADLIRALLASADNESEAQQVVIYERILTIEPNQPVAKARWQAIWVKRGELAQQDEEWNAALEAFQKAGDTTRVEQVLGLKRKQELEANLKLAQQHEVEEKWQEAITVYQSLLQEYPDEKAWQTRLQHTQTQATLAQWYNQALGALETGNTTAAQRSLAKVIAQQPTYKEAARHLLRAVAGIDVVALQKAYRKEQAALKEERAARQKTEVINKRLQTSLKKEQDARHGIEVINKRLQTSLKKEQDTRHGIEVTNQRLQTALEKEQAARKRSKVTNQRLQTALEKERAAHQATQATNQKFKATLKEPELQSKAQKPEEQIKALPRLWTWNPLDHLRLLWWLFMAPQNLTLYQKQYGKDSILFVGNWLVSTLTWLPLFIPALALGIGTLPSSETAFYLWASGSVVLLWLLTGSFGNHEEEGAVLFVIGGLGVASLVMFGVLFVVALEVTLGVAMGVALGIARAVARAVARAMTRAVAEGVTLIMMGGVTLVVVGGMALAVVGGLVTGVAAGVTGVAAGVTGVMLGVMAAVEESIKYGRPSWQSRLLFAILLLDYAFMIWYAFLGGAAVLQSLGG